MCAFLSLFFFPPLKVYVFLKLFNDIYFFCSTTIYKCRVLACWDSSTDDVIVQKYINQWQLHRKQFCMEL